LRDVEFGQIGVVGQIDAGQLVDADLNKLELFIGGDVQ